MADAGLTEDDYLDIEQWATSPRYTQAERTAIEYAEKFCMDHLAIDQELIDRLRQFHTDAQILDITYAVASWMGLGRVMQVMQVEASCPLRLER